MAAIIRPVELSLIPTTIQKYYPRHAAFDPVSGFLLDSIFSGKWGGGRNQDNRIWNLFFKIMVAGTASSYELPWLATPLTVVRAGHARE